jgi:hypothetical protein
MSSAWSQMHAEQAPVNEAAAVLLTRFSEAVERQNMEAVQRAREAVEVGRGQIYEKARDLVFFQRSQDGEPHGARVRRAAANRFRLVAALETGICESGSGRPQLGGRRGLVQRTILADCIMRRAARPPSRAPPSSARLGRLDSAKFARDLKVGGIFPCRFGRSRFLIEI